MTSDDFDACYATALRSYLETGSEEDLAVGHELGRRALRDDISTLKIVEQHSELVRQLTQEISAFDSAPALAFLLQTLAPLDIATRGFLDGTKRYEEQRARAEDLADRDVFRNAVVNSLQEGFFVSDDSGAVIEVNDAFRKITGYSAQGLPYQWPHPWLVDIKAAEFQRSRLHRESQVQYETPIRHHDGRLVWVAANVNRIQADNTGDVYVGTLRDITAERAFAARESAVLRLATAVSVAKSMSDVLSITLDECRLALDVHRVVAAVWPTEGAEPTIQVAGERGTSDWRHLDPALREMFEQARRQLPLTVHPIESPDTPGQSSGVVAVLTGGGGVALWLELRVPRRLSGDDRLLITVLVGHLGLAIQHVRQFEAARETSLTLQHAMLAPAKLPPGFAVRYEPAVPPLEIGGDWYDVLRTGNHQIGIIVGDCVGRGLAAAAVMGQLRASARALLLTGAEPARLLEELDAVAELIPDAFCTTVFLAVLNTESGELSYSCAGHLPAVLAAPGKEHTLITDARSVPLAVQRKGSRPQASVTLAPGSTLMLYTDGLVERRDVSLDDGIAHLGETVAAGTNQTVDDVADAVLTELVPPDGYDDDIAIVVYRRPYPPLAIHRVVNAGQLGDLRHELADWLSAAGVVEQRAADIVLAVNEAVANSIEHGYQDRKLGKIRLKAENDGARVRIKITDKGSWKPLSSEPGTRGRGLLLIRAVSDWLEMDCTPKGTTVDMSFSLSSG
ncbi:stage II sporulation protein E [Mycobacterium sp. 1245111.1]|uniref:SpoIIE family protein phosphatase n=1 Tax=Mycobacterium sp. 1245111.1 TaxID=1834073 RepID=UPI0007FBB000|nr:SpoIIE family protein phosphatase [Mycobacterium sp. 1245111.1]OBK40987.1 stage II sporulation protein E [Mycobacterium sp. 1245111.1]